MHARSRHRDTTIAFGLIWLWLHTMALRTDVSHWMPSASLCLWCCCRWFALQFEPTAHESYHYARDARGSLLSPQPPLYSYLGHACWPLLLDLNLTTQWYLARGTRNRLMHALHGNTKPKHCWHRQHRLPFDSWITFGGINVGGFSVACKWEAIKSLRCHCAHRNPHPDPPTNTFFLFSTHSGAQECRRTITRGWHLWSSTLHAGLHKNCVGLRTALVILIGGPIGC